MLTPLMTEDARRLADGFKEAGYTEAAIRKRLGLVDLPTRALRNEARLLDRTHEHNILNLLLRLFWLGRAIDVSAAEQCLPKTFLALLLRSQLLRRDGDELVASAMLMPVDTFLVASDHPSRIERGEGDLVLWPNPTSRFLGRFMVKTASKATLDLGTGSGILSLWAAAHSETVVATDLNARAASFAAFNARLNGIETIEVLAGESFAPVSGRRFDLVLCNPPFFISPRSEYMFCDNAMDLDQLCRDLLRKAPEHLNEGGYVEMLCEWAQIEGESWEERVGGWLEGTGCDGWVMKGATQAPEEYAQQRIRDTNSDPTRDLELFDSYMKYYRERKVEAIHDGLIVMRRRSGENWIRIEEVPKFPIGDLGEMVVAMFKAEDFLRANEADEELLEAKPKLAASVRLEQICEAVDGRWHAAAPVLRLTSGFPASMTVQPLVAEFLVSCDGRRTAREVIQAFAAAANSPLEKVQGECLAMLRTLIGRGFVVPSASEPAAA